MPTDILLICAGGHAKVVYAALRLQWPDARVRLIDDDPALGGSDFLDLKIETPASDWASLPALVHVCVGNNSTRRAIAEKIQGMGKQLLSIVHPAAIVSSHAEIADGAFIAAGAIVGPCARIGAGAIINHAAVVDHDCQVGDFAHVAPNATLGGGARIGMAALLGAGAVVLPTLEVGDGAVVGAGAVVNCGVAAGQTVAGIPARPRS